MSEKFTRYDTAEYLKTDADMAAYLDACLEEAGDDPAFIANVLGVIARAHGMTQLARDTGLARENLYKALSAIKEHLSKLKAEGRVERIGSDRDGLWKVK